MGRSCVSTPRCYLCLPSGLSSFRQGVDGSVYTLARVASGLACPVHLTPSSPGCRFPDLGLPGVTCTVRYWECCLGDLETRSPAWLWIWASSSSGEGCTDLGCWVLGLGGKWCESPPSPLRSHFSEKCQCFREAASPPPCQRVLCILTSGNPHWGKESQLLASAAPIFGVALCGPFPKHSG